MATTFRHTLTVASIQSSFQDNITEKLVDIKFYKI